MWLAATCARACVIARVVDLQKIRAVLQVRPPLSLSLLHRCGSKSLTLSSLSGRLPPVSGADMEVICSRDIAVGYCLFLSTPPPLKCLVPLLLWFQSNLNSQATGKNPSPGPVDRGAQIKLNRCLKLRSCFQRQLPEQRFALCRSPWGDQMVLCVHKPWQSNISHLKKKLNHKNYNKHCYIGQATSNMCWKFLFAGCNLYY